MYEQFPTSLVAIALALSFSCGNKDRDSEANSPRSTETPQSNRSAAAKLSAENETIGLSEGAGRLHIRSVLEDSSGRLWIGNNGLGVLLIDGGATIDFSTKMGLVAPGSQRSGGPSPAGTLEHVFAIEEDRLGNIWFGDGDTGAWKYDGKTMTNYSDDYGLPFRSVWDLYRDKGGELLFALDNGAVYQFNGKRFSRFPLATSSY